MQQRLRLIIPLAALAILAYMGADIVRSQAPEKMKKGSSSEELEESRVPQEGFLLPNFQVEALGGGNVRRDDLLDKPTFLNFWASWCGPCRVEMPHIEEIHREQGDNVNVLTVNLGEPESVIRSFLSENDLTIPVAIDETYIDPAADPANVKKGSLFEHWGYRFIPTSVIADRRGKVCGVVLGAMSKERMLDLLGKAKQGC